VTPLRAEINGRPATAAQLAHFAITNYGHFTAMQVRDGSTRGLDLHLARLEAGTRELYDTGIDGDRVRHYIRHALGDLPDASVRTIVFWPEGDDAPSVMVVVRPPAPEPSAPLGLRTVPYQRPVAHVKHLGGFGQTYYRRLAEREGYDEALLTGPDGVIAEGAITNLGCHDGSTVVFPDAPALAGITMQLLERHLPAAGIATRRGPVRVGDLASFTTVFAANSRGVAAVDRVDDLRLRLDPAFMKTVTQIYASVPWDPI